MPSLNRACALNYTLADLKPRITTVILDFGGVLGMPQDPVRAANMASLCGRTMEDFTRLYQRDRLELDRGTLSSEQYWARIFEASGVQPSAELIARIEEEDSLGWTRINERVVGWSRELRAAGYATAILSNMPFDKLAYMRKNSAFDFIDEFPVTVFSCDHRVVKPEPEIYDLCLKELGRAPEECVFLDDSPVNVAGGRAVGLPTLLFGNAEEAAPVLAGTWGLPVRSLTDHR
jgi:putative hydrolase of the HAD superfamily